MKLRLRDERTIIGAKIKEALSSVLPVGLIVLALCLVVAPVPSGILLSFLAGAVMLIVGMGMFSLGAEMSMTPMGEYVGSRITRSKKLWLVIVLPFFVGVLVTISEPDLQVLANQISSVPRMTLILSVAVGVGVFLVVAMLRILFRVRLTILLLIFYVAVFVLAAFVNPDYLSVAFDSGGVTTGPVTVPFIMAVGVGVASIRSDRSALEDSFGLVALCSIGPIAAVMALSMVFGGSATASDYVITEITDTGSILPQFLHALPVYAGEVALALGPMAAFFLVYQWLAGPVSRDSLYKILIGLVYTYIGMVLFFTGVNVGFMPAGHYLGKTIGAMEQSWIIIPIGMLIGYFLVAAEPAVQVLTVRVEEMTSGSISRRSMSLALGLGVSASVGLAMVRVVTGLPILWILIPGYAIALILSFFVPRIFAAIAFDSGGVASGPMTATFLLPFAVGACGGTGGNPVTDAFGLVAMVAMTPLIAIQLLGLAYKRRLDRAPKEPSVQTPDDEIL